MKNRITNAEQLRDAINLLLEYNWDDEERDYQESEVKTGHIFQTIKALHRYFNPEGPDV